MSNNNYNDTSPVRLRTLKTDKTTDNTREADSSYNAKRKTDVSDTNQSKSQDKYVMRNEDKKTSYGVNNSNTSLSPDKRSRSPSISSKKIKPKSTLGGINKKNKKKVSFKPDKVFVEVINVESYKKYNIDNVYNEPAEAEETTRCKCIIF